MGLLILIAGGFAISQFSNEETAVKEIEIEVTPEWASDEDAVKAAEAELNALESNFEASTATYEAEKSDYKAKKAELEQKLGTY